MERINNGLPIRRNSTKPLTLHRKLTLEILQRRLLSGEITPSNYVKNIPNFQLEFQNLDYSTFLSNPNESEVGAESQSDEEINSQSIRTNENEASPKSCRVCLLMNADTIMLPCRHAQICYSCVGKLAITSGVKHCPICRGIIEQYFQKICDLNFSLSPTVLS